MKKLFEKYREIIEYVFWGVLTTVVNWAVYTLCVNVTAMNVTIATGIAWLASVLFAFITNKLWVFHSKDWQMKVVGKEAVLFFGSRIFSGLFEMAGMWLLVDLIGWQQSLFGIRAFAAKIIISVVVVILNYFLSRWIVFKKKTA